MNQQSLPLKAPGHLISSSAALLKSYHDELMLGSASQGSPKTSIDGILFVIEAYEKALCNPQSSEEQSAYDSNLRGFLSQIEVALAGDATSLTSATERLTSLLQAHPKLSPHVRSAISQTAVRLACAHSSAIKPATVAALVRTILSQSPTGKLQLSELDSTSVHASALKQLSESFASVLPMECQREFLAGAINCLHTLARGFTAPDTWHIKLCTSYLSCIASLIPLAGQQPCIQQHCAALADSLRVFWSFGVETQRKRTSSGASCASSSSESVAAGGKYVPPWQRRKALVRSTAVSSPTADSSHSDSDTSATASHESSSKVRISSLRVLTLTLRNHPAALHQVWDRLLPPSLNIQPVSGPRGHAPTSLLGVLLGEPSTAVRTSAAVALQSMMTGTKNIGFMRVARSSSAVSSSKRTARPRAFMPLSETMAAMLMAAHSGLAQCVRSETSTEVLAEALKASTLLLQHTPYHNMQRDAPQKLLHALGDCWNKEPVPEDKGSWQRGGSALSSPRTPRHEGITTQCAILTAFAAALQTPVAASVLSINLTPPNPVIPAGAALKPAVSNDRPSTATASNAPFTEALMQAALLHHVQPAVQWEACCALRMLCSAPVPVQRPAWPSISSLVNAHLQRVLEATSRSNAKAGGGNGGTSASLPEKVLNQAVRLAGDWMRALLLDSRTPDVCPAALESSPGSVEASVRVTGSSSKHHGPDSEVSVAATGFVQLMVQCAAQAGVPVLRSAAFAAIAAAPPVLWVVLEQQQLEQLVVRLCSAAKTDGVPSTRAQAINALKSIVDDISSVAALGTELDGVACALAEGCSDASASVRGASAAALAALCTTLRDTVHSVDPDGVVKSSEEEHADPVALEKHAILNTMAQPRDGAVAKIDVNVARSEGNVRDGVVIGDSQSSQIVASGNAVGTLLQTPSWRAVSAAALHVARGGDKVRANGVRATGCLLSLLPPQNTHILPEVLHQNAALRTRIDGHHQRLATGVGCARDAGAAGSIMCNWSEWCQQATNELCHSMKAGNAKCAWNACIAATQLFSRATQLKSLISESDVLSVHTTVLEQLKGSQNFKVRIHAAHAVQAAGPSCLPTDARMEVLSAVVHAIRSLGSDAGCQQPLDGRDNRNDAAITRDASTTAQKQSTSTINSTQDFQKGDEAPANYRYHAELTTRLTGVLVDFLAVLQTDEVAAIAGDFGWIAEFLEEQVGLWSVGSVPPDHYGAAAAPEQGSSPGQSTGLPENMEEVPVRGGRLQLLLPSACSNVLPAVSNLLHHTTAAPHQAVLQRLHADLLAKTMY